MSNQDADIDLKMRMQKVLWSLGFYTRVNVKLSVSQVPEPSRDSRRAASYELTDLDVLGIRIGADFTMNYTVADCKSGKAPSPVNRAFWLSGVMNYFSADRGYIALSRDIPNYQKEVATRLGITLVDETNLRRLEEHYIRSGSPIPVGDAGALQYLEGNLSTLSREFYPALIYRKQEFWFTDPARNVLQSIAVVQQLRDQFKPEQKFHRVLLVDMLTLFSLSLLQICSVIFQTSPIDFKTAIRSALFGGAKGLETRQAFLDDLSKLAEKLMTQARIPFTEDVAKLMQLDPPYFDKLAERAVRLVNRPNEAKDVLRYLQAFLMEHTLYDRSNLPNIFGDDYSEVTLKFVSDLAQFYVEATGVNPAVMPRIVLRNAPEAGLRPKLGDSEGFEK